MQALTRKFCLEADVSLHSLAAKLPNNLSGADIYAYCADALTRAIHERISASCDAVHEVHGMLTSESPTQCSDIPIDKSVTGDEGGEEDSLEEDDLDSISSRPRSSKAPIIHVGGRHFEAALQDIIPSVTAEQAARHRELQRSFQQ